MVVATAGFCYCRRSPALPTFESMVGRWATFERGVSTATISAGLLKPLSSPWLAHSTASFCRRGLTEEQCFSSRWALSNLGAVATRRAYYREGDGGRPKSQVVEVYEHYGGQQQQERGELPRPPLIQWEKDLANAVQLIGRVGRDVQIKYLDSGKVVATTSLAVRKGSQRTEDPSWFQLEIWDAGLAEIAAHHVAKGEQIFVAGSIVVDKNIKDEVAYTNVKVLVRDLYFVEPYSDQRQAYHQSNDGSIVMGSSSQSQADATNVGSSQRDWNQQQSPSEASQGMVVQKGSSTSYSDAALATEKKWQEYFADPTKWWDNRSNKKNPKWPDFKHKSTQEALWINSWNNPPWVAQQLAVLEEKKAQHSGHHGDSSR